MSVSEARNMIGRPFLQENKELETSKLKSGIIRFIAVYGNATAIQIKNLVGYPDLIVIKTTFGYYLWESNMHIQMFFLTKCINPQTIRTRFTEVSNWLNSHRPIGRAREDDLPDESLLYMRLDDGLIQNLTSDIVYTKYEKLNLTACFGGAAMTPSPASAKAAAPIRTATKNHKT